MTDEIKDINASLKKVGDELKAYAEQSQKELKRTSDLSEETKASVDKLLITQGELQARLQAAEQHMVKLEGGGGEDNRVMSLGQHVAESEAFANFDPKVSNKFSVGISAAITSIDSSAGSLIEPTRVPGVVAPQNRRLTIRDLIAPGRTQSNSIEYVRETGFTNNADVVSENPGNVKPESDIAFELDQAKVATIAHWVRASKQVLDDAAMLASYIDARLRYGLQLKEEAQLLKGSGIGLNINGIYTQASTYANPGVVVQAQTRIDQLRLALLQAELAEYYADGIVLSPIDWTAIELTKDSQNRYVIANPFGTTPNTLWARPVVSTQSMDVGDFLVGAFQLGAQVWDREDATVVVSTEDRDNLVKNMVTILAEERLGLTVYRPEAFVKGEFEAVSG
jgi:HK97 family phage major capsid protein